MTDLPPGVTIAEPPPELMLGGDDYAYRHHWHDSHTAGERLELNTAAAFPEPLVTEASDALYACSGSVDTVRYQEATKFRAMADMGWEEARIALNRLYRGSNYAALASFALAADGHNGFVGKKGDHAVKLRDELGLAIGRLKDRLKSRLGEADRNAAYLALPFHQRAEDMTKGSAQRYANAMARSLWAVVPAAADRWVRVAHATPDEIITALMYLRSTFEVWNARRPEADSVAERLQDPSDLPSASDYTVALHIAEMLVFTAEKLLLLDAGILYSMPIYRLYPAISEPEAIALWWPWGRPVPLIDGAPPRPPRPRKQVLDPSMITATRPQDVVREVMAKTGINRTTAQRMTAALRRKMRRDRRNQAERLLGQGLAKAEVARRVGLSPSRISALFRGKQWSEDDRLAMIARSHPPGRGLSNSSERQKL